MWQAASRVTRLAALAVLALAAALVTTPAPAQHRREAAASRPSATPRLTPALERERDAYWAGVIDGYRARDRSTLLPGGPYGPLHGYPTPRYAPQPGGGIDHTYAPWARGH